MSDEFDDAVMDEIMTDPAFAKFVSQVPAAPPSEVDDELDDFMEGGLRDSSGAV